MLYNEIINMKLTTPLPPFYCLFKRIYRKRLESELRDILGYYNKVGTYDGYGASRTMSWKTFIKGLFR